MPLNQSVIQDICTFIVPSQLQREPLLRTGINIGPERSDHWWTGLTPGPHWVRVQCRNRKDPYSLPEQHNSRLPDNMGDKMKTRRFLDAQELLTHPVWSGISPSERGKLGGAQGICSTVEQDLIHFFWKVMMWWSMFISWRQTNQCMVTERFNLNLIHCEPVAGQRKSAMWAVLHIWPRMHWVRSHLYFLLTTSDQITQHRC